MQLLDYKQQEFSFIQQQQQIKVCNMLKDSFHSNFSLVLKRVFSKFYPEMVIDYAEELASFCKEWLLGIGCAVSG